MKKLIVITLGLIVAIQIITGCSSAPAAATIDAAKYDQDHSEFSKQDRDKILRLLNDKKWNQAVELLTKHTEDNPSIAEAWFFLASAYLGKKDYHAAIEANMKAVEFSKVRSSAYYNLACAYSLLNQKDQASQHLDLAMKYGFLDYDLLQNDPDIELLRKSGLINLPKTQNYKQITHNGIVVPYAIILPENYDPANTYPAMLAYPPGSQGKTSADWFISEFWGEPSKTKGWIIVVPVAPPNGWINHPSHHALNHLLRTVKNKHKIEGGKFHMVGFESGARPAATFALMSKQYFQSLTTISSNAWDRWNEDNLSSFKIMPVKIIVGGDDEHGIRVAQKVHSLFQKHKVMSDLEIITGETRHLPSLRNAELINKIEGFVR